MLSGDLFRFGSLYSKHFLKAGYTMRLLTTFGLIIASFFTSQSFASIYDTAPYLAPKVTPTELWMCTAPVILDYDLPSRMPKESCYTIVSAIAATVYDDSTTTYFEINPNNFKFKVDYCRSRKTDGSCSYRDSLYFGSVYGPQTSNSYSCPPDANLSYTFEFDTDKDGDIDKCFDPSVLSDLTNCSAAPDFMANSSGQTGDICRTQPEGQQCGYIAGSNGSMVKSSSVDCYDDTPVDEFGNDGLPNIEPDKCTAFGSGYVCSADPAKVCSGGVCPDQCGTVETNNVSQFVCFNDTPNLPNKTDPTDPSNDLDPTIDDPANPDNVNPTDPTNALSQDLAIANNRLGQLIQLTRDKGNDTIYAVNKQTGQLMGSLTESNQSLKSVQQTVSGKGDEMVAAVDRSTGEVISIMRESQVKLAELGENIFLTKDIQQDALSVATDTKQEITTGFDNIIEFMKSVDEPDPITGDSKMDTLITNNSDDFGEIQSLLNDLLDSPGIKSSGGSGLTTDPETGEEVIPNAQDWDAGEMPDYSQAFDHTDVDLKIEQVQLDMKQGFKDISSSFQDAFALDLNTSGSLPCLGDINYGGRTTSICLDTYSEQMNWIGLALLFGFTMMGFIIIFK